MKNALAITITLLVISNFIWYQLLVGFRKAVDRRYNFIRTVLTPRQLERVRKYGK